ncbi:Uncharacterised protein [Mycobacteroides abscessus subsp. massiliense]|nr:Uncharacterised protein [Mycobacteroides abscessus subsp. massiliense]
MVAGMENAHNDPRSAMACRAKVSSSGDIGSRLRTFLKTDG